MNRPEFIDLHTSGVTAMRVYFDQAEKTTVLLAKCTAEPLPFLESLALAFQEIAEIVPTRNISGSSAGSTMLPGSAIRRIAS